MAHHKIDPEILAHQEWIGFVRPTGLVVSGPALVRAGAILDRRDAEGQRLLRTCVAERVFDPKVGPESYLPSFRQFADSVLGWNFSPKGYAGTTECPILGELEVSLTDYGETLRPDFAVRELEPKDGAPRWQLLVRVIDLGEEFDHVVRGHGQFEASAHSRMERLLRQTGVTAGLLFNGRALRIISAPRGESSGWLDFRVSDMVQTAGRPISTAMRLLLSQARLLSLPRSQRFAALLEDSREFQNEVSEKLAEQVLHALYEFLRGFQSAHDASNGELLRKPLSEHPDEVYRALLTVILRLVFLLFAEEKDMLPEDETFLRFYSLTGLYERLREDAALFPDTMDQRYGAWAQILVLFRMVYDGAESGAMRLPKRHGVLFDPDRFPFLEGRSSNAELQPGERIEPPLVPDGTVYRALEKLLVLDGERISYRALDVEQIGSVYETMMGFRLERATGRSIAIRADKKQGAPTAVNLEALLAESPAKREKWIQDQADRKISDTVKKAAVAATTLEDLHAALMPVIDLAASPDLVSKGAMVLQPSEERRRSGSHYTPRELTNPIVRTTLEPIFSHLRGEDGRPPRPEQVLELKVCDPAMGSGAFLVEACRQLGEALVEAWHTYDRAPVIPGDEDEHVFARRMIAQRCLYGVDKNPVAVDLAKMSLWLVTLAKDHALTFVDHALRCGDSLVGLTRKQIEAFHWDPSPQMGLIEERVRRAIDTVSNYRSLILAARDNMPYTLLKQKLNAAEDALSLPKQIGDAVTAAFFAGDKPRDRENTRLALNDELMKDLKSQGFIQVNGNIDVAIATLDTDAKGLKPFHWEIEFPEVFRRENRGFDAMVGNPPFMGGSLISGALSKRYLEFLKVRFSDAGDRADFVVYFFRSVFDYLGRKSSAGLIATNTIWQGDSRRAGLSPICLQKGVIFNARRRYKWPAGAAVIVSVVHFSKGLDHDCYLLDDKPVRRISAYLLEGDIDTNPHSLEENRGLATKGVELYGPGFIFDDDDNSCTPLHVMRELEAADPKNAERILSYLNGDDVNKSPIHASERFVINFGTMTEHQAKAWPDLFRIVEDKVKPYRLSKAADVARAPWWLYWRTRSEFFARVSTVPRLLVCARHQPHWAVVEVDACAVLSEALVVFAITGSQAFALLQSRVHETWARFFGSSMKDDLRYTPSDCFETFPLVKNWQARRDLEISGKEYSNFRAALMVRNDEGLTKTYNRFHDPGECNSEILKLRELHAAMDRAVLDAYGWSTIPTACEFQLDYEVDEKEWGNKKKPWRYRWPNEVRDEVLARLLELNTKRAKAEELSGAAAARKAGKKTPSKGGTKNSGMEDLF